MDGLCVLFFIVMIAVTVLAIGIGAAKASDEANRVAALKQEDEKLMREHPEAWMKLKELEQDRIRLEEERLRLERVRAEEERLRNQKPSAAAGVAGALTQIALQAILKR